MGAGLRASEVVELKVGDVGRQRMTLRIEQGKGRQGSLRDALAGATRSRGVGMWSIGDPTPPWEWRKGKPESLYLSVDAPRHSREQNGDLRV